MKILLILIFFLPSMCIGQPTLMISHNNEWITKNVGPFSPQISYIKKTFSEETMIIDGEEYKELLYVNFQNGSFFLKPMSFIEK